MNILTINPGGTSTKISVFKDKKEVFKENISHTQEDLNDFKTVFDQYSYRKKLIVDILQEKDFPIEAFDCVVGRGGLMKAIAGGTYEVNDKMIDGSGGRSRWTFFTREKWRLVGLPIDSTLLFWKV